VGGQIPTPKAPTTNAPKMGGKKGDKVDLSVDSKVRGAANDDAFGLGTLGESTPPQDEGISTTTGSTPARKKKPTIFLLGEKP